MPTTKTVALVRPIPTPAAARPPKPPRRVSPPPDGFYITPQTGNPVVVPIPPMETTHDGFVPEYSTVPRGRGRAPLLLEGPGALKQWSTTLTVAYWSLDTSIDPVLQALERLATSHERVAVHYGRPENGSWRITGFSYIVTWRNGALAPSRATVDLQLTAASDPTAAPRKKPGPAKAFVYTVKRGDTLSRLAKRYYGSTKYVRHIMQAQKPPMRRARPLRPGRKLRITPL